MPFGLEIHQPSICPYGLLYYTKQMLKWSFFLSMFMKHVEPVIENEIKAINLFWIQAKIIHLKVEETACVVDVVAVVVDVVVPGRCFCFV